MQHTVETVSFDMFDTLLVRRTHDPDLVKLPVARFISNLARAEGFDWNWREVQLLRDDIENAMRALTGESYDDHEARYPVFMQETLEKIFGEVADASLLDLVTQYEMQMENAMLVP
ncbi:MAG: hypothetical protein WBM41_13740, partial [Arenicellales bacterium]